MPYLDDVCIKRPKTKHKSKEILLGIRQFVAEHLLNIDKVLADIKRASATISSYKSNFCYPSIIVVSYRINKHSRYLDDKKIKKITKWPQYHNAKEVRMFISICVYYRV